MCGSNRLGAGAELVATYLNEKICLAAITNTVFVAIEFEYHFPVPILVQLISPL